MNRRRSILTLAALSVSPILLTGLSAFSQDTANFARRLLETASPLGDRSLGKADAPVVMIEYASATCPHCAEFHEKLLPQIKTEYIDTGKVRFIFREFPLDQLALGAFMLARCVPEDKYFAKLDLASELSNVSRACKIAGYSRQPFYEIRRNFQTPAFAGAGSMARNGCWIACPAPQGHIPTGWLKRSRPPFLTMLSNTPAMAAHGSNRNCG